MKYYKRYWLKNRNIINKKHRENYKKTKGKWHKKYHIKNRLRMIEKAYNRYYQFVKYEKGYLKDCIKWQKKEDNILKKYYGILINSEIQRRFLRNRTMSALQGRARKLKLQTHIKNSNKQKKILSSRNKENLGKTYEEIYGQKKAKELKKKFSLISIGKNNPSWKGGKSNEPYPLKFNINLREQIRQRDKVCQICKKKDKLRKLCVHHIDRNKNNLNPNNLISLCFFHHAKISNIQDDLKDYFYSKLLQAGAI